VAERLGTEVPIHFTAFHPDWKMRDKPPTPRATVLEACRIARSVGLHHVYSGNIHDKATQSTYCQSCGSLLIGRDWHAITAWHLDGDGCCRSCGALCAGIFDGAPESRAPRRGPLPLDLTSSLR